MSAADREERERTFHFSTSLTLIGPNERKNLRTSFALENVIVRFDAEEEARLAGELELGRVKDRMIRLRQPVHRQHPEDAGDRGEEHGELKRDRHERGPAMQRTPADIQRVIDHGRIPLHPVAGQAARNSADQHDQRDARFVKPIASATPSTA